MLDKVALTNTERKPLEPWVELLALGLPCIEGKETLAQATELLTETRIHQIKPVVEWGVQVLQMQLVAELREGRGGDRQELPRQMQQLWMVDSPRLVRRRPLLLALLLLLSLLEVRLRARAREGQARGRAPLLVLVLLLVVQLLPVLLVQLKKMPVRVHLQALEGAPQRG